MKFLFTVLFLFASQANAWVHINKLKPKLPADNANDTIYFYWDGISPRITQKEKLFDGQYADSTDADLMFRILREAFAKWNDVEASYLLMQLEIDTNVISDTNDRLNTVTVSNVTSQSIAAFATPQFLADDDINDELVKNNSIIHDCDITISNSSVSAVNLYYTLIHEIGHCVGLGHPHSNYGALMGYSRMSRSPTLGADDIAGVSYLYPSEEYKSEVENFKLFCSSLGAGKGSASIFLFAPLLIVFLRRQKS